MHKRIEKQDAGSVLEKILLVLYFTWFLFFLNKGIDITDQSYVLTLYKNVFDTNTQTGMGTILSMIFGGVLWKILPTAQVWFMSLFSALLYTIDGFLIYRMLRKYVSSVLLLPMMLGAGFFAITWVRVLHYNAWSMFFLTIEIYLLYRWFEENNRKHLFGCGVLYGINIWVRIPNAVQGICLFAVIWYIINKKEKELWKHLAGMLVGALLGFSAATVLVISVRETDEILYNINQLFAMGTNVENGHSFTAMFQTIQTYLYDGLKLLMQYVFLFACVCVIEYIVGRLIKKMFGKNIPQVIVKAINIAVGIGYALYIFHNRYDERQMFSVYIVLAILLSAAGAVIYRKKNLCLSSLCVVTVLLELVIKLGTDVSVKWNMIFLYLPLGMITCLCIRLFERKYRSFGIILLAFIETMVFLGGGQYALTYVFRDADRAQLNSYINAKEYIGIKTSAERAEFLDKLDELLDELPDGELLAIGNCTIGSVISDLKPALIGWPDLASYPYEQFCSDLDAKIENGTLPYILCVEPEYEITEEQRMKYQKVLNVVNKCSYKKIYEDDKFALYLPPSY